MKYFIVLLLLFSVNIQASGNRIADEIISLHNTSSMPTVNELNLDLLNDEQFSFYHDYIVENARTTFDFEIYQIKIDADFNKKDNKTYNLGLYNKTINLIFYSVLLLFLAMSLILFLEKKKRCKQFFNFIFINK